MLTVMVSKPMLKSIAIQLVAFVACQRNACTGEYKLKSCSSRSPGVHTSNS